MNAQSTSSEVPLPYPTQYVVQPGDTMFKIAQQVGVSLAALEAANPQIKNFNVIWPGMTIRLPLTAHQQKVNAILATAVSLIGTPYQWGGDQPQTGFDCSGFVAYVYAQNGIILPRTSHDQATVGTPVAIRDLAPGDLIFLADTYPNAWPNHVTHVGIYAGNGSMIESTSVANRGVVLVRNIFQSSYYMSHYWGARRVIP
ncbi:NLP/P60 [Alicyclobacillus cellulosilyticus]|uniref:NLP/P60 n=1 Tax=Alicyclobacillus cellulosilyticus TaxID=1003997 RepID=A0A917NMJ7_9BACL|nr:NLP/P60 [Alicyclobacillus cellulosilyticus]